jgi:hypothetical protein
MNFIAFMTFKIRINHYEFHCFHKFKNRTNHYEFLKQFFLAHLSQDLSLRKIVLFINLTK